MQSVPITTNVVSSNPALATCTRYNNIVNMRQATCLKDEVLKFQ